MATLTAAQIEAIVTGRGERVFLNTSNQVEKDINIPSEVPSTDPVLPPAYPYLGNDANAIGLMGKPIINGEPANGNFIQYNSSQGKWIYTSVPTGEAADSDLTAIAGLAGTSGFLRKTAANTWTLDTTVTPTEFGYLSGVTSAVQTQLTGKQASNANLTTIAGLTPLNDDILQRKSGAWINRTVAQFKTDLNYAAIASSGSANDLITGTVSAARLPVDPKTLPNLIFAVDAYQPNKNTTILYATDSFSRANSTSVVGTTETPAPTKTWTTRLGTAGISSSQAYGSAMGADGWAVATIDTGQLDGVFEADVLVGGIHGLALRVSNDGLDYILVALTTSGIRTDTVTAGSHYFWGYSGSTYTSGTTYRLAVKIVGSYITASVNGTFAANLPITPSNIAYYTATNHGFAVNSTSGRIDNFSAQSVTNKIGLGMYEWDDLAGQGWTARQTNGTYWPVLDTIDGTPAVRNITYGSLDILHPALDDREVTVIAVGRSTSVAQPQRVVSFSTDNALQFINGEVTALSTSPFPSGLAAPSTTDQVFGMVVNGNAGFGNGLGRGVKVFGALGSSVFRYASASGSDASWIGTTHFNTGLFNRLVAGQSSDDMIGHLRYLAIYNRALTDAEVDSAKAWLRARYGLAADTAPTYNIVFEGDSLTASGQGTATDLTSYPDRVTAALSDKFRVWNVAVYGQTMTAMAADAATQVDPLFNSAISKNVFIIWGGTNELGTANSTAIFNILKANCLARRAAGFKVIVLTTLPRGAVAQFETDRLAYNALIRADTSFYDALADVGADANIGVAGSQNNLTYYLSDKIHLNVAGHNVVAGIVSPVLASV